MVATEAALCVTLGEIGTQKCLALCVTVATIQFGSVLVSQHDYRIDDDKYTLFGSKIHSHELQFLQIHQTSKQCTKTDYDYSHKLNPFSSIIIG